MMYPVLACVIGLALLAWGAKLFIEGAAFTARHFRVPPLLIGVVIVGFGTSAPELVISSIAAWQGSPGIALGNAFGSNISNIGLILGVTAVLHPVTVRSGILRKELPILAAATALLGFQIFDNRVTRLDGLLLLAFFAVVMGWMIWHGLRKESMASVASVASVEVVNQPPPAQGASVRQGFFRLGAGLILLVVSSRMLVWGAVEIAESLGVSDLVIGLTVIAVGTSLPELASAITATLKGQHDLAMGNVVGSNLFNTLAVVGVAATIEPMVAESDVFWRDMSVMAVLTAGLFVTGYRLRGAGRINRYEGAFFLSLYVGYVGYLVSTVIGS